MTNSKLNFLLTECRLDKDKAEVRKIASKLMFGWWININDAYKLMKYFNTDEFLTQEDLNICHLHNIFFKKDKTGRIIPGQQPNQEYMEAPEDVVFYLQRAYNFIKFYKFVVV